ncbi:hypothetical protein D3C72_2220850 [compost metagenome]
MAAAWPAPLHGVSGWRETAIVPCRGRDFALRHHGGAVLHGFVIMIMRHFAHFIAHAACTTAEPIIPCRARLAALMRAIRHF